MIKFGDTNYFELLGLQDKLKNRFLDRLNLENLSNLKEEIDSLVKKIHEEYDNLSKS